MSKTIPFQTIQFSISTQSKCKYTVYLSKAFLFQAIQFSQTVLIQTIQFSISMQLVLFNPIRCYHSGLKWTWKQWQWRGALHFPALQHHWSLTIRSFSVISKTLIGWGLTPLQISSVFLQPQPTGHAKVGAPATVFENQLQSPNQTFLDANGSYIWIPQF